MTLEIPNVLLAAIPISVVQEEGLIIFFLIQTGLSPLYHFAYYG